MADSTRHLSILTVGLLIHFSHQYGFKNCIGDQYSNNLTFTCSQRAEKLISLIVGDLPASAINITIGNNSVTHIPTESFIRFFKLENLCMDSNTLKFIDGLAFRRMHQLRTLSLSFNSLSKLNCSVFQDLYNLTYLSLEHNLLEDLPQSLFTSTPQLNTLILRNNSLHNFSVVVRSVSSLSQLKTLDLGFNFLTSLTHLNSSLPKSLTELFVCGNKLLSLACADSFLTNIRLLDLSKNVELSTTAFKGVDLAQIRYLQMGSTKVKIFEFFKMTNVDATYVDFSDMGLTDPSQINMLCTFFRKSKHTTHMTLKLNRFNMLPNTSLTNCPQITGTFDISSNNLKQVKCLEFLEGQKRIKRFEIEHNHINQLLSCKGTKYNLPLTQLSFRYNRMLSVDSDAFAHTPNLTILNLNINSIASLNFGALRGLTKLQILRLDNNVLTELWNSTFEGLSSLETLNLRNNRIAVIFYGRFLDLGRLTILDLGGNKISHIYEGGLKGLKRLRNLYLDGNNLKQIDSIEFAPFQNTLEVLDLLKNQIRFTHEIFVSPFVNLSSLRDLKLGEQQPSGISRLPHGFFRGLHSLKNLYLTNNRIDHLASDTFDDLTGLAYLTLDNSCNGLVNLEPGSFKNLRNLKRLSLQNMGLQNLSNEVFGNLSKLQGLYLTHNVMQHIDVEVLDSLRSLSYLDIRKIPLSCSCQNLQLQNWTLNNHKVQLIDLHSLRCKESIDRFFFNFDTNVCFVDLGKYMFFITAAVIFVSIVVPLLHVKLYWKTKYGYYVFRAWFSEQWRKLREDEENCEYDAFISYNFNNEAWVLEQLLPNLEGNGSSFKLCLHHRDFEPGRNIVDNIVSAVYGSRKTLCVVSRNFLQSEWCSLEIQLASYRLFDEHRDVLLLVFLEHISERELSSYHRMRKVMLRKTYLQWPGSECTDPALAQLLFWKQLRRALRTGSRMEDEDAAGEKKSSGTAEGDQTDSAVNPTAEGIYH
ncbi:unnamed protein product [Arctogadus glacialis]